MELPKYHETFMPILEALDTVESLKSREFSEWDGEDGWRENAWDGYLMKGTTLKGMNRKRND